MIPLTALRDRLEAELLVIEGLILDLWRKTEIEEFRNDPSSGVIIFALSSIGDPSPQKTNRPQSDQVDARGREKTHLSPDRRLLFSQLYRLRAGPAKRE